MAQNVRSDLEAAYSAAWTNHRAATAAIEAQGLTVFTERGAELPNPAVKIQQDSAALMARLVRTLSALPAERTEEDPLDDIAAARARRRSDAKVS